MMKKAPLIFSVVGLASAGFLYYFSQQTKAPNKAELHVKETIAKEKVSLIEHTEMNVKDKMVLMMNPPHKKELTIYRPSEKVTYEWQGLNEKTFAPAKTSYHLRVISPSGEILIDEETANKSIPMRNFAFEGEYQWEVTPIYDGRYGKTNKQNFIIKHPELAFVGDLPTEYKLNGIVQKNGDILFENGRKSFDISWEDQMVSPDEKYLVEISETETFNSFGRRKFVEENKYVWDIYKNGDYYLRVTRVSPFGISKGVSNVAKVSVSTRYPLPQIVKAKQTKKKIKKAIAKNKVKKKRIVSSAKTKQVPVKKKRQTAAVQSSFKWKWSYLIPKEAVISVGQGAVFFGQKSDTTDTDTDFALGNLLLDMRFQESDKFFVDTEILARATDVKNVGEFSDQAFSALIGKEFNLGSSRFKAFGSIGARYSSVNYFEQNFSNDIISAQKGIFSGTAQAGIIAPLGEQILNKLRVIVDVGQLNQVGLKYNGRYNFVSNQWFVDLSGGLFNGTYKIEDDFNKKEIERSEVQMFFGIGRTFK